MRFFLKIALFLSLLLFYSYIIGPSAAIVGQGVAGFYCDKLHALLRQITRLPEMCYAEKRIVLWLCKHSIWISKCELVKGIPPTPPLLV